MYTHDYYNTVLLCRWVCKSPIHFKFIVLDHVRVCIYNIIYIYMYIHNVHAPIMATTHIMATLCVSVFISTTTILTGYT